VLNAIMRVPADKLPQYVGSEIENAGYLIAQVTSVKLDAAGSAEQRDAQARVLMQQAAAADEMVYAEGLKARHNVKVLKPEFQRPVGSAANATASAPGAQSQAPAPK
jgi:hypothetical protein